MICSIRSHPDVVHIVFEYFISLEGVRLPDKAGLDTATLDSIYSSHVARGAENVCAISSSEMCWLLHRLLERSRCQKILCDCPVVSELELWP